MSGSTFIEINITKSLQFLILLMKVFAMRLLCCVTRQYFHVKVMLSLQKLWLSVKTTVVPFLLNNHDLWEFGGILSQMSITSRHYHQMYLEDVSVRVIMYMRVHVNVTRHQRSAMAVRSYIIIFCSSLQVSYATIWTNRSHDCTLALTIEYAVK